MAKKSPVRNPPPPPPVVPTTAAQPEPPSPSTPATEATDEVRQRPSVAISKTVANLRAKDSRNGKRGKGRIAPDPFLREVFTDLVTDPRSIHTKHAGSDRLFEMMLEGPPGLATFLWNPNPHFAAFLRKSREDAGLSIRQAAPHLGVSAAYISRLETGGYASAPSVDRLFKMADLYAVDRAEMLTQAGVRVDVPEDAKVEDTTEAEFAAMLMDAQIKPTLFTADLLHYVPSRLKRQWIEWALKLTAQDDPREYLLRLIHKAQGKR